MPRIQTQLAIGQPTLRSKLNKSHKHTNTYSSYVVLMNTPHMCVTVPMGIIVTYTRIIQLELEHDMFSGGIGIVSILYSE